jgi:beta-xylosidase
MKKPSFCFAVFALMGLPALPAQEGNAGNSARNPILHADVPDIAVIRVGDTYYMSSSTMHLSPGLPIMMS